MVDYRKKSLRFLYDVMRGKVQEYEPILDKANCTIELIEKPVTVEGRMKAAERILRFYTDQDKEFKPEDIGIVILPKEEFTEGINQSTQDC